MRFSRLLLVVSLVAALAPHVTAPWARAAETRELIVSGETSGYVDVELDRSIHLKCCRKSDSVTGILEGLDIKTQGSYAALVIEQLSKSKVVFVAIRLPSFDALAGRTVTQDLLWKQHLLPGRYRVYLFTDGETTARLSMRGLDHDLRVSPEQSVQDEALIADLGATFAFQRYDLATSKDSFAMAVVLNVAELGQFSYQDLCITERGSDCDDTDARARQVTMSPDLKRHDALTAFFPTSELPKGPSEAIVTVAIPGSTAEGEVFVLVAQ
jgi:hypothetical protein